MVAPAVHTHVDARRHVTVDAARLPGLVPGATDTRHFVGVSKEILRFVPMQVGIEQMGGAHGRDERVAVETLGDSKAIAIGMVRRAAAGPGSD